MDKLMLLGGGKIGHAIATMMAATGDYELTVADKDASSLKRLPKSRVTPIELDVSDKAAVAKAMRGHKYALSAMPYHLTPIVAGAAKEAGAHYFDLTEDVESTRVVKQLAKGADTAFVPQCGLAPGFISIVANDVAKKFDALREVKMRVGALPVYPTNALKYNLTWSTDGLINEYCNPCEAIVDGKLREVPALEEMEHFSLDGIDYEAFNTSGGLGTLCETLEGKVEDLNYKTVRYPGHRDIMKDVLEASIPITFQDVVLVFVSVSGMRDGRLTQESYSKKVYAANVHGELMSAIQITTAAGICAMVDLMRAGKLPQKGFVRQEQAHLADFLANRFGRHYA